MAAVFFDEDVLNTKLLRLLKILEYFCAGNPVVLRARAEAGEFAQVLLSVVLRQVCSGEEKYTWPALKAMLWHMECVLYASDGCLCCTSC